MSILTLAVAWAVMPQDFTSPALKVLAILGGAVLGAFLVSAVGRLLTRLLTTRPVPTWAIRILRLVGGVAAGWLVYLFVFGGGGKGVGGPGGLGLGGKEGEVSRQDLVPKQEPRKKDPDRASVTGPVRVEVLGDKTLEQLGQPSSGPYRGYRLEDAEERGLHDFKGLTSLLRERFEKAPSPRVILVFHKDSPYPGHPVVTELTKWLNERKIPWKYDFPYSSPEKREAPGGQRDGKP